MPVRAKTFGPPPSAKDSRPCARARGYDRRWEKIRRQYLARHPICKSCGHEATEVHHRRELIKGGTHAEQNLAALCKPCHSRITAARALRDSRSL